MPAYNLRSTPQRRRRALAEMLSTDATDTGPPDDARPTSSSSSSPSPHLAQQRRHLAVAAYVCLGLLHASTFLLFIKLLSSHNHVERRGLQIYAAKLNGFSSLIHMAATSVLPAFTRRGRLSALFVSLAAVFAGTVFLQYGTFLNADPADPGILLTSSLQAMLALYTALATVLDAVLDAACRGMKVHLQPARKAAAALGRTALITQLLAPSSLELVPATVVVALALAACAWCSVHAHCIEGGAGEQAGGRKGTGSSSGGGGGGDGGGNGDGNEGGGNEGGGEGGEEGRTPPPRTLPLSSALGFAASVVVGRNGEELVDCLSDVRIDDSLSGGSVGSTIAKVVVSIMAAGTSLVVIVTNYRNRFVKTKITSRTVGTTSRTSWKKTKNEGKNEGKNDVVEMEETGETGEKTEEGGVGGERRERSLSRMLG